MKTNSGRVTYKQRRPSRHAGILQIIKKNQIACLNEALSLRVHWNWHGNTLLTAHFRERSLALLAQSVEHGTIIC